MNKLAPKKSKGILIMKALTVSYIITGFILLLLAFLMYKANLSGGILSAGIIVSYIVSSFIGGFIVGKAAGQKRFMWGILVGVLYFLILLMVSIILNKLAFTQIGSGVTVLIMCSLGGMLGGMVS